MAFVIVSTGALARSRLHTVATATLAAAAGVLALVLLMGGVALGYRLAQSNPPVGQGGATAALDDANMTGGGAVLDATRPENRALIERIGSLSGRLIRLESEAIRLAKRVGLPQAAEDANDRHGSRNAANRTSVDGAEPSGGPLMAPMGGPEATDQALAADGFAASLQSLVRGLDRIEANLSDVAQATTVEYLNSMAFPSRRPVPGGRISSGFGNRVDPFTHRLARHTGVDMPAPFGAPILASAGGRVRFAGRRSAYGNTVEIDHGNGLVTRYGHASRLYVHSGDVVLPGQKIAAVGSTGRSTGPHLHFEVLSKGKQVEPRLYLARAGS